MKMKAIKIWRVITRLKNNNYYQINLIDKQISMKMDIIFKLVFLLFLYEYFYKFMVPLLEAFVVDLGLLVHYY